MIPRILCVLALISLLAPSLAQGPVPSSDPNRHLRFVGTSDVVLLAAVQEAKSPEVPKDATFGSTALRKAEAEVTLKVEKVLKGTLEGATLKLAIPLRPNYVLENNKMVVKGWMPEVTVGKRFVLGLIQGRDGLKVPSAFTHVQPGEDAGAVEATVKSFPVQITLTAPATAAIGEDATWQVTVKNVGTKAMDLKGVSLLGYFAEAKMDGVPSFTVVNDDLKVTTPEGEVKPRAVQPGGEVTFKAVFAANGPTNWRMFDAKLFPLKASLTATVQLQLAAVGTRPPYQWAANSSWQTTQLALPAAKPAARP